MRSSLVATTGFKLARSPSARAVAQRRRLAVAAALACLAGAGAAFGYLSSASPGDDGPMGPFSYFPSE
ncbi:hypothetical protein [Phenylobacterium sp.]|uniref:hypothetical protein n=1 Tax=Phenylobacterium sp. TaxID=1871053 RepID=UPI0025FAD008|nr:hypothetical protein [Phenylobacterium sp.]